MKQLLWPILDSLRRLFADLVPIINPGEFGGYSKTKKGVSLGTWGVVPWKSRVGPGLVDWGPRPNQSSEGEFLNGGIPPPWKRGGWPLAFGCGPLLLGGLRPGGKRTFWKVGGPVGKRGEKNYWKRGILKKSKGGVIKKARVWGNIVLGWCNIW